MTAHLKEIAGRLKKLSYREMVELALAIDKELELSEINTPELIRGLLDAADAIEAAP